MRRSTSFSIYLLVFGLLLEFQTSVYAANDWVDVSVGDSHTIALKSDGRAFVSGYTSKQFQLVATGVIDVAAIGNYNYMLKSDGTVWKTAFGYTSATQTMSGVTKLVEYPELVNAIKSDGLAYNADSGSSLGSVKEYSSLSSYGSYIRINLSDNSATAYESYSSYCIGGSFSASISNVIEIAGVTAYGGSCGSNWYFGNGYFALKNDSTLWAMAANVNGGQGSGSTGGSSSTFNQVASNVSHVTATQYSTFVIKFDNSLWVAGFNGDGTTATGLFGDGTNSSTPIWKQTASNVVKAIPGKKHAAIVKSDGTLWVAGDNSSGQLGFNDTTNRTTWSQTGTSGKLTVSKGAYTNKIALSWDNGDVFVTGTYEIWRSIGLLGSKTLLATVNNVTTYDDTSALEGTVYGYYIKFSNATTSDPDYGYLSPPTFSSTQTGNYIDVSVGSDHTIALKSNGNVYTAGLNTGGQLADGTNTSSKIFKEVATGVIDVAAYGTTSYILKSDGSVWKTTTAGTWTQTMTGVTKLKENLSGVNAIKSDGTSWDASTGTQRTISSQIVSDYVSSNAYTFGINSSGTIIGTPSGVSNTTSIGITEVASCTYYSTGYYDTAQLLKTDGTLWTVGYQSNAMGLGLNPASGGYCALATVASWTKTFDNVKTFNGAASGTLYQTFALQNDGNLWVTGNNTNGNFGDGTTTATNYWKRTANGVSMAIPGKHSAIVKTDGTLWVTGSNASGQLGFNDTTNRNTWFQTGTSGKLTVSKGTYANKITLSWDNGDGFVTGTYEIWRSSGLLGSKTLLATVNNVTTYDDTSALEGTVYGYYIKFSNGTITDPDYGYRTPPTFSSTQTGNYIDVSVGFDHTIALKSDGRVFAAGLNSGGQLGDGTTSQSGVFKQVATGVTDVAAFGVTSYILKSDGTVWKTTSTGIWSQTMTGVTKLKENLSGVNTIKGDGTAWDASTGIQRTISSQTVSDYVSSNAYTFGINSSGTIIGTPSGVSNTTSIGITEVASCTYYSTGYYDTAQLLKTDGTLWTVGYQSNAMGLGLNPASGGYCALATVASWTKTFDNVKTFNGAASGTLYQTFALQNDGNLWVTGNNTNGNLGDGTTTATNYWKRTANGVSMAVPGKHSAHIKSDGTLWVTGANASKQHGLNDTTNRTTWTQTGFITPGKVAGVNATDGILYSKVTVSWTADVDATQYDIYRSTVFGSKGSAIATNATGTTYDDTTVSGSTHYFYTVVAKNPVGSGPDSDQNEGYGKVPATLAITATQGTLTGKVALGWTSNPDATAYQVWRSTTAAGTATQVATLTAMPASGYEDTTVSGISSYFYTVKTVVGTLVGSASNEVEGWANGAPTAATASLTASSTSASAATGPTVTDPNVTAGKTETYTLVITTQPDIGVLTLVGNKFVYTPPADGLFSGPLTFEFTATDKGGSVISGTGAINVVCGSPTISAFTLPLTSVTQATPFDANATFSLPVCATNGQIKVDVLDSNSVVVVAGTPLTTPNGAGLTHTFTSAGVITAGSYTVRMTATSDSGTTNKTATLTVKAVNLLSLSISPGLSVTVGEETVTATLSNPSVVNCPFTGDPAVASANPSQCYISFNTPPSGMSIDNGGALPAMSGIIDTAGSYPITAEVFKHDGTALQKIGQVSKTVVAACTAPAVINFDIPALLPYEVPNYASTYKAYSCNGALTGFITIKKNTTVIETLPLSSLTYGTSATLTRAGTGLASGNYTAELSISGSYGTGAKTQSFQVKAAPMPTLSVSPTTASQGETRVDVVLTPSTDTSCPLTTVQSEAEADPKKCYVALSTTLPDMSSSLDSNNLPVLAGYPSIVGDYSVQALVSRWVNGTRYDSDPLTKNVKVTSVVPPVFAFTGKSSVYVGIEKTSLIFKQDSGTTCSLYTDQSTAQTESAKGKRACFVNFIGDDGLAKTLSLNQYKLEGALTTIGTQTLGYTVKRQFADGLTTELQTGSYDVTVNELPPPQITLKGGYKISEGKYYVPLNQAITRATINAGVPTNAKMKIQLTDSQQTFERGGVMNGGSYWLSTPALGLLEERPVTLRVSWQDYPQVYNEQVITAVGGTESNMKLVIDAPLKTADTDPITVKVNVGKYTKTGVNYTPDTMGQWRIQILGQTNTQTIKAPITEMKDAVNGEATFQINPAGNLFMKLTAVAELVSNVNGLDSTLTSSTRYVEVVKGSPIEGTISAKTLDGPAPKTFTLYLDMTLDNRVALKEVSWEESTDDGVTWKTIEKSNIIRHNIPMAAPSKVKARAKMTNKNTQAESYTEPVEVWAYATLDAQIVGPRHVAPGYPITLAAQLYREGVLTTDTVNEWTIEAPSGNSTQTGPTVTVTEETEGKIYLTLRSRPADTRTDDPNAWSAARSYVVVATPTRPSIYAKGPRDVETGKVYTYTGTVRPSWGSMESVHSTASEWQLPDGTTVSGETLDWSPTTQDLTDKIPLIFRSWVNGFKETTTSETKITYVPWEYVWPNWTVTLKQLTVQAPSDLILLVNHDRPDMNRRFEGLTYEWSFPSGVTGRQNDAFPNRAMAQALYAGEYDIQVTIRDTRGNQTTLTQHITAQAAVPYTVTIKVGKSNYYDRAPMTITVRPTIYGGHPLDSVIGQSWFVDGQPVDDFANRSYMVKEITDAGNHSIRYTLNSKMGETATVDSPLFLAANQLPICELTAKPNAYVVYAEAKCTDPDGKVIDYSWQVNGQPIGSTSYRISFSKTGTPQTANVTITAMDDAKELSIPVSINIDY